MATDKALNAARDWLTQMIKTTPRGKARTEQVLVDPAMASAMLERNTNNGPVSQNNVQRYAQFMLEDRWHLTSQGIGFDAAGALLDGQHRLMAVVASNKKVPFIVTFGLDRAAFDVYDTGRVRGASYVLTISGEKNTHALAAALRMLMRVEAGELWSGWFKVANDEVLPARDRFKAVSEYIADGVGVARAFRASSAAATAALYIIGENTAHRHKLPLFIEGVRDGINLDKTSPIWFLREAMKTIDGKVRNLDKHYKHQDVRAVVQLIAYINTWNAWVSKKKRANLSINIGDGVPEII